jgi:hypothetical protein
VTCTTWQLRGLLDRSAICESPHLIVLGEVEILALSKHIDMNHLAYPEGASRRNLAGTPGETLRSVKDEVMSGCSD